MAFTLVRPSTSTTWRIQQRYVNTGLDENIAARLWLNGTPTSLALVTDRQGGYIMGLRNTGTEETSTGFYLRNAFGKAESGSTFASSQETHLGVGFAGAGTPTSAAGGYVYLRNRWYDPGTGRFLSQDPIGLAGGVNLYAYAGNDPVSYDDPYGLCPWCIGAAIGAVAGAGYTLWDNHRHGRPLTQHLVRNTLIGTAAGATLGLGYEALAARGAVTLATADGTAAAGSETVAAETAAGVSEASSGAQAAMERQFARDGARSLQSTIRSLTKRIAEHEADIAKYRAAGGHVSSMEREVAGWRQTIEAAQKVLEANQ